MTETFVHPSAVVDGGVTIGAGTRVWHFCHLSGGARIGARCSLGQNVFVGCGVSVGDGVKVQNNVSIYRGVEIGDEAFLGPSCVFTNVSNPRAFVSRGDAVQPTRVGHGASIGANATIVCGHDIGAYALVGAGAVVTSDIPPHAMVVGNPARRIAWACACGERLPSGSQPVCGRCGEGYRIDGELCQRQNASEISSATEEIPFFDLSAQNSVLRAELLGAFERVLHSGRFILGEEVAQLERDIAHMLGCRYAIGVSSGTDALFTSLMALGISRGDEVITTPFSFVATAGCIARLGAVPVFADIDPATFNLDPACVEAAITRRTRAIVAVHLFGQPCSPQAMTAIGLRHDLPIIEDAAQALGARTPDRHVGTLGKLGCFSFFPTKNLGAFGDAGLVTTDDASLAAQVEALRTHGATAKNEHLTVGGNFRLDALQAALLRVKLPHLPGWIAARQTNAARYEALLRESGVPAEILGLPRAIEPGHVWNQYVVRTTMRDQLRLHLSARGIATEVYYPRPLHLQSCFEDLGYRVGSLPVAERAAKEVLALPIFPELGEVRQVRVAREILSFFGAA